MALCRYIFPWSLKLSLSLVIVSELSPRVQFPGKGNSIVSSIFSMIGELTCNCWIFPMIDGSDFWVSFNYYSRSLKSFYDVGIWFPAVIMLLSLVVISNVLDRAYPGFLDCGFDFGFSWIWIGCPGSALLLQFDIDFLFVDLRIGCRICIAWFLGYEKVYMDIHWCDQLVILALLLFLLWIYPLIPQ